MSCVADKLCSGERSGGARTNLLNVLSLIDVARSLEQQFESLSQFLDARIILDSKIKRVIASMDSRKSKDYRKFR